MEKISPFKEKILAELIENLSLNSVTKIRNNDGSYIIHIRKSRYDNLNDLLDNMSHNVHKNNVSTVSSCNHPEHKYCMELQL